METKENKRAEQLETYYTANANTFKAIDRLFELMNTIDPKWLNEGDSEEVSIESKEFSINIEKFADLVETVFKSKYINKKMNEEIERIQEKTRQIVKKRHADRQLKKTHLWNIRGIDF